MFKINEYLERIALENTDFVKLDILTDSFEGRPMKYLKVEIIHFKNYF